MTAKPKTNWLKGIQAGQVKAKAHLAKNGYTTEKDIQRLLDETYDGRWQCPDYVDEHLAEYERVPAHIAEAALLLDLLRNIERDFEDETVTQDEKYHMAFMAGVTNLRFSCFQLADSLDAHWAGGPEFPWIFAVLADGADKEAFRSIRMKKNRIEQAASANVERNKAMCDHALKLREQGKKDHELANHIWRTWHSRNIWAQYKSKAFTSDRQVRKILQENGILPSKKNQK